MKKVCMMVWNDMRHDARVSKEAKTLTDNGYDVTVLSLYSDGLTKKIEKHSLGYNIYRINRYLSSALDGRLFEYLKKKKLKEGSKIHSARTPVGILKIFYLILMRFIAHMKFFIKAYSIKADVYHAHDINVLPTLWLCAKLRRRPIIYDAHEISTSREGYQKISSLVFAAENFLTKRVAGMITTTDMRADIFVKDYKCERPVVLQNRPLWFKAEKTSALRDMLGIPDDKIIVLYQGGMQAGRGLHNILKAAEEIEGCVFVFIGSGRLKSALEKKAAELDLSKRVYFMEAVPFEKLYELTASADIGMQILQNTCLNHYTTDSNKLFEYIMCGLPAVVSDFPEIRKVVEAAGTGILVDPDNIEEIVSVIKKLAYDEMLRDGMIKNCREHSKNLSWEEQEHKLTDLYRSVIKA